MFGAFFTQNNNIYAARLYLIMVCKKMLQHNYIPQLNSTFIVCERYIEELFTHHNYVHAAGYIIVCEGYVGAIEKNILATFFIVYECGVGKLSTHHN